MTTNSHSCSCGNHSSKTSGAVLGVFQDVAYPAEGFNGVIAHESDCMLVRAFAFAKGGMLKEHKAPNCAIATCLEGELDFTLEGTLHHMHAGDFIFMAPGAVHEVLATTPARLEVVVSKH